MNKKSPRSLLTLKVIKGSVRLMSDEKFVIITSMKNEAPFIVDWVAYHLAIGFDHFIIATNDCEDNTNALIDRLAEITGQVERHRTIIRHGGIQRSALRQCFVKKQKAREADWIYIADVDEYLNIKIGDGNVRELVALSTDQVDCIPIPWRIFGATPDLHFVDKPVIQKNWRTESLHPTRVDPRYSGAQKKSLFRNFDKVQRPGVHLPAIKPEYRDSYRLEYPGGVAYKETDNEFHHRMEAMKIAHVNHYMLRSAGDYLVKVDRGRINHTNHRLGIRYWQAYNRDAVVDRSILRHLEAFNTIREQLLIDPELLALHQDAVAWHEQRIQSLRTLPEFQDLIQEINEFEKMRRRLSMRHALQRKIS